MGLGVGAGQWVPHTCWPDLPQEPAQDIQGLLPLQEAVCGLGKYYMVLPQKKAPMHACVLGILKFKV